MTKLSESNLTDKIKDLGEAQTSRGVTTPKQRRSSKMNYSEKGVPSLLSSGYFIQVHPEIIKRLGSATQAIVLQQLSYWLERAENIHNGENWVYNTYEDWAEQLGLSASQIKRAITALEDLGVVVSCQPEAYDRIKWYRIDTEHEFWQNPISHNEPIQETKSSDGRDEIARSTIYTNTTHIEPKRTSFDEFWEIFPRKTGKGEARKSFEKALKKTTLEIILESARRYALDPNREDKYTCHPATWLNQERWDDDPLPSRQTASVNFLERYRNQQELEHDPFAEMRALN